MATPTKKRTPRKAAAGKKTVTKRSVAKKTPAKKAPVSAAVKPSIAAPDLALRKKQLIERVVARSGIKKKDAKPTIEATLAILGEALEAGEEMNLQPFGKIMIKREIDKPNARMFVCRIRRRKENTASVVTISPKSAV